MAHHRRILANPATEAVLPKVGDKEHGDETPPEKLEAPLDAAWKHRLLAPFSPARLWDSRGRI